MSFLPGKVPTEVLQKIVFKHLGTKRNDVVLGPSIGEDAAIVEVGKEVLAIATDPITGAEEWLGWLAVNVSANDVATCGVQPRWFTSCILLPKGSREELVEKICRQMDKAAQQLNVAIIGGHCEITPGLEHPIVTGCSIGIAENGKYVTSNGAKAGNMIILTKGTGIEGTAILASDRRKELLKVFDESFLIKAENFFTKISVVKDALTAFQTGGVLAMHDPTEGGVAGGLHELADASNVGFQVYEEKILVSEETRKICAYFEIGPLQLISSGSLLIVAEKGKTEEIVSRLSQNGVPASVIGEVTEPKLGRKIVSKTGEKVELVRPISDHLWTALAKRFEK
ncbi:MAG: thiamine monophosphate kinase [Candidatus Bathyarchaeota archaeon BA2]|nr:MAG: thiamine monophosphate kinase [Candidatus Bathyarchaeota archaeon BA2]